MLESEKEYLAQLRGRLIGYVSSEDLDDILSDYAEHFSIGRSEGRSDEEISAALGSPEDVAGEIRAIYLVKKAEHARNARNIWHAVMATLGLGVFTLAIVLIPFIFITVLLVTGLIAGLVMLLGGPILLLVAALQLVGIAIIVPWWTSPVTGIFIAFGVSVAGLVLLMLDFFLAGILYRYAIRFLLWNIRVKKGETYPDITGPSPKTMSVGRDGASALDLRLRFGAGEIDLGDGTEGNELLHLTAGNDNPTQPYDCTSTMSGTVRTVRIRSRSPFPWHNDMSASCWNIRLNREVPVALDLRNIAGRSQLDLGNLNLTGLKIKNGAGETRVDLAGYHGGDFDALIRNGMGHLVIRVPRESNTRIRVHHGMGDTDIRGLMMEGNTYVLHSARPEAPRISCQIKRGIGALTLEAV